MTNLLTLRSYNLPDLAKLIKEIWPQSHEWRIFKGKMEFSLPCEVDKVEWFPLHYAPEKVEKFVKAWVRAGGLSAQERIDL